MARAHRTYLLRPKNQKGISPASDAAPRVRGPRGGNGAGTSRERKGPGAGSGEPGGPLPCAEGAKARRRTEIGGGQALRRGRRRRVHHPGPWYVARSVRPQRALWSSVGVASCRIVPHLLRVRRPSFPTPSSVPLSSLPHEATAALPSVPGIFHIFTQFAGFSFLAVTFYQVLADRDVSPFARRGSGGYIAARPSIPRRLSVAERMSLFSERMSLFSLSGRRCGRRTLGCDPLDFVGVEAAVAVPL